MLGPVTMGIAGMVNRHNCWGPLLLLLHLCIYAWWSKCSLVNLDMLLGAVVTVGMPGMLGMPGKLGMVAAGFSIFGGGSLRNVPTVSRQTSSGASAAGGCSAAPSVLSVVRVPSAQARASLCWSCCPRAVWGWRHAGRGAPDTPQTHP